MNNPIKGAVLKNEPATVKFRGEEYCYTYYYYVDPNGQRFTTTEIDEKNVEQVYSQYRKKYGIPSLRFYSKGADHPGNRTFITHPKDIPLTQHEKESIIGSRNSAASLFLNDNPVTAISCGLRGFPS